MGPFFGFLWFLYKRINEQNNLKSDEGKRHIVGTDEKFLNGMIPNWEEIIEIREFNGPAKCEKEIRRQYKAEKGYTDYRSEPSKNDISTKYHEAKGEPESAQIRKHPHLNDFDKCSCLSKSPLFSALLLILPVLENL